MDPPTSRVLKAAVLVVCFFFIHCSLFFFVRVIMLIGPVGKVFHGVWELIFVQTFPFASLSCPSVCLVHVLIFH